MGSCESLTSDFLVVVSQQGVLMLWRAFEILQCHRRLSSAGNAKPLATTLRNTLSGHLAMPQVVTVDGMQADVRIGGSVQSPRNVCQFKHAGGLSRPSH
jgi:hypothetical protein